MNGNVLTGLSNHKNFSDKKKNEVVRYITGLSFIVDETHEIDDDFLFDTKFPLGKTGKKELIDLLCQIDGENNPFDGFDEDFNKLDSILQTRHTAIHQDRFSGTEQSINDNIIFLNNLVEYIDTFLFDKEKNIKNE